MWSWRESESQRIQFQIIIEEKKTTLCFYFSGYFKQPLELQLMQTSLLILLRVVTPLHQCYMWDCVYGLCIFSPNVLQISPQSTEDGLTSENNRRIDIIKFSFSDHGRVSYLSSTVGRMMMFFCLVQTINC